MRENPNGQWLEWEAEEGDEIAEVLAWDGVSGAERSPCIY